MVQDVVDAGAEVVMDTDGQIVYYNSGRKALDKSDNDKVLQLKSGLPSWQTISTADSILSTQGDILYEGASGLARLGAGTSGQFLKTQGASNNPVWADTTGKLELISHFEEDDSTGDAHTFTFNADLTDDYAKVCLFASYFTLAGELYVTINNETGAVYAQGAYVNAGSSRSDTGQNELSINHDTTAGDTKTAVLEIYGNSDDGRLNGFWTEQASLTSFETGAFYMGSQQSGTITSIELSTSASAWGQGSTFDVYGWKI